LSDNINAFHVPAEVFALNDTYISCMITRTWMLHDM